MKKAEFGDMELGNMVFGNSRGTYVIERESVYEAAFMEFLKRNGFSCRGAYNDEYDVFENDTFVVRPYYWGDDEDEAEKPNFKYKPDGFEIRWYKYPMRDAYSNQDVSVAEFAQILAKCEQSMKEARHETN